ncbi:YjgF-like protein [Zopfia rhizophila CBS 207.26]|uniref:YjgF-like protein n=1 Tax=Zopfia rhizophila CBS 207.26 TaxID=1314779 RepID=A0A6A6D817_9PEZI|nr:YjgF-like protein [Zopfia rhizophila CBS 207.26]
MRLQAITLLQLFGLGLAQLEPNFTSSSGVSIFNPSSFFDPTGPWSLMSKAGDTLYIAGMRGIFPSNNTLAPVGLPRIRQAYQNMAALAELAGADLNACVRLVVYTTDMFRYRPICNQVQIELWGNDTNRYPPRTIIEVDRLNDDDIVEVEGTFYVPQKKDDDDDDDDDDDY